MELHVFNTGEELAEALARRLRAAFREGPTRAVMLAGGRTPLAAYAKLADHGGVGPDPAWVFLSDERMVPWDSPNSNRGALLPLLLAARLRAERFIPVITDLKIEEAAARFSDELDSLLSRGVVVRIGILGLGTDGHTASLFSLDDVARAKSSHQWAVAVRRPSPPDRISTTPQLFARIAELLFVVSGPEKAEIAARLVREPETLPAGAATAGHPAVSLWLDRDAAARL